MATARTRKHDRITTDPQIMVGKPVIRGTRIPVERVLGHLAHNLDLTDLFGAYPHLTVDDVKACLAYARDAVEAERRRAEARASSGTSTVPA